jgi:uracil-DNA glycosylase
MIESIGGSWGEALGAELSDTDRRTIEEFLANAWAPGGPAVYPRPDQVFRALEMTPITDVRAVILGQDPYPTEGQACGLAFSVPRELPPGVRRPPSLGRILAEVRRDGFDAPRGATLERWTEHVLLLNAALAFSVGVDHKKDRHLWKPFTDAVIQILLDQSQPIAFLLWGQHAKEWRDKIRSPHEVLCSPHPMARGKAEGFARSRPFFHANAFLGDARKINWSLE